jgi:hypothetical protein
VRRISIDKNVNCVKNAEKFANFSAAALESYSSNYQHFFFHKKFPSLTIKSTKVATEMISPKITATANKQTHKYCFKVSKLFGCIA